MARKCKHTKESLLKLATTYYNNTGKVPTKSSFTVGQCSTISNRFGSWNNYLLSAGLQPRRIVDANILKICTQCGNTFTTKTYKEAVFCSTKCSNTSRKIKRQKQTIDRKQWLVNLREQWKQVPFENLKWEGRRKRVIHEQHNKCKKCNLDKWMGQPIVLEVDHINGNREDHSRTNLEALCPNCHSLTPTWRGKNKSIRVHLTDEEFKSILENTPNIHQALIVAGLSPRGENYKRAKRIMAQIH